MPDDEISVVLEFAEFPEVEFFSQESVDEDEEYQQEDDVDKLLEGPLYNLDDNLQIV